MYKQSHHHIECSLFKLYNYFVGKTYITVSVIHLYLSTQKLGVESPGHAPLDTRPWTRAPGYAPLDTRPWTRA